MNRTFFEELPARKVGGPVVSSGGDKPAAKSDAASSEGGNTEEKSAKKVRQAVYDIRYRARREGVDLKAAYSQYMGNTTMTGPEKDAVKQKLFGEAYSPIQKQIIANKEETIRKIKGTFEGPHHDKNKHGEPVGEELEEETKGEGPNKKFKIRVTDKASGRTYVRFATREKINSLRANPNIKSVEMTEYGSPYEGEAKKGEQTAATTSGKGLDPVGKEDGDVDNDGDKDKSDKYLLKRRSAIGKAMASRNEEVEQVDEFFFGPKTVKPKNSPTNTKSVEVDKKYPARLNGRMVNVQYDKEGNKRTSAMTGYERGIQALKMRNTGHSSMNPDPRLRRNSFEPEGEVLEAAPIPRTDVKYDKNMKQYVPTGGVPVRRARGGPALPGEPGRPGSGGGGRPLLPGEKPFPRLAKKKANTQMAGYEPEGELVDESPVEFLRKSDHPVARAARALVSPAKGSGRGTARPSTQTKETMRQNKQSNEEFTRKESTQFNNWREEFIHEMGDEMDADTEKKVTGMKGKNKVIINPKQGGQS